jgi:hypothetical protein
MTTSAQPRIVDEERLARVMLALLDDDIPRANRALVDAHDDD